jgi:hypothetical protein
MDIDTDAEAKRAVVSLIIVGQRKILNERLIDNVSVPSFFHSDLRIKFLLRIHISMQKHEVKVCLLSSVIITLIWWGLVNVLAISFPWMQIAMIIGAVVFVLPSLDEKEYPHLFPIPTRVYIVSISPAVVYRDIPLFL